MANITQSLLHGYINYTHTSNLTAYYPPQNLPMPWPLVTASLIMSLIISCYGVKHTVLSWTDRARHGQDQERSEGKSWMRSFREYFPNSFRKSALGKKREPVVHETELEDLHKADDGLASSLEFKREIGDTESETLRHSIEEPQTEIKWAQSPSTKVSVIIICAYCTLRAVVTLIINLGGIINGRTTPSAPSILLLVLVSIQIFISNRDLPRIMNLILTMDSVLVSIAFLIVSYAPYANGSVPSYAHLGLIGGTCPVHAGDCQSQATHWTVVGCANYTYYQDLEDNDNDEIPSSNFYVPYATSGDVNVDSNALHIVEAVIFVFGTIWLFTVLFHVYVARHLFTFPLSGMLLPLGPGPLRGRRRCGPTLIGIITLFGVVGAFVATIISIAGHMSQALGSHHTTYIDSVGPASWANLTRNRDGVVTASHYWGNSTSWNDRFTVTAPTSTNGFWNQWVQQNGDSLYRIAVGI